MGAVYVAEQMSLRETRALKVMRSSIPGLEDPERLRKYRERFLEEARRSSGLRSAHVVKVVASGIDEATETPWLAMELLHGEDLDTALQRRGRLSWAETRILFEQVGHGLAAAHGAGVLHLDLKPENLFVAEPESPGVPFTLKVLDFGIGRVLEEQRTSVTATTAVGSPLWMSPEQALKQRVSAATDLWALGLIAYRCLTGRHYWREANKPEEEFAPTGWILELMTQPLEPASVRALEQGVDALLPRGFDAWFARCVTRDRETRWQSVDEMLGAFRELAMDSTPPAVPLLGAAPAHAPTLALREVPAPTPSYVPTPTAPPTSPSVARTVALPDVPPQVLASSRPSPNSRRLGARAGVVAVSVLVSVVAAWGFRQRAASSPDREAVRASAATTQAEASSTPTPSVAPPVSPTRDSGPPITLSCPDGMALVPGGHVVRTGGSDDAPIQSAEARPFCITRIEVPVAAYRQCVRAGACAASPGREWGCNPGRYVFDDSPMRCIPWQSAQDYCAWVGGRLPTDAEWELAARGNGRPYPWGSEDPTDDVTWSGITPHTDPTVGTIASLDRTPEGVFDLAGNLSEWVSDACRLLEPESLAFVRDEGAGGHVNRGGNFVSTTTAELARSGCLDPPGATNWVGFRCVTQPIERSTTASDGDQDAGASASD